MALNFLLTFSKWMVWLTYQIIRRLISTLKTPITRGAMKSLKKIRLSESVTDAIKEMIVRDGFNAGDKFYSEKELTEKLGVSRSSIREALKMLEVAGQVIVKQGKGTFIDASGEDRFKAFATWLKNNEQAIKDNFEVRLIIEPKAAGKAAEKANSEDILKLEEAYAEFVHFAHEGNTDEVILSDRRFHRWIAAATKNNTLHVLMKSMTTVLPNGWISSLYTPGRIDKTIIEHGEILAAIKRHDKVDAETAMTRHLVNALHDISQHIKQENEI
jgi:GntR family transcriptional regulator, transcriptional repressor for pyruvate dehydrogenase complex